MRESISEGERVSTNLGAAKEAGSLGALSGGWANVVPTIEAIEGGIQSVVLPHGGDGFLSHEGLPVRAYVVGDARECLLVDAGYGTRLSFEAICSAVAGRRVAAILLTHRHPDHGGGARALAARFGAPVRAHALEATSEGADPALAALPLTPGEAVSAGGRTLTAVDAAGHSRGSLAFHEAATGLLFSGDAVLGEGTVVVGPPDGDMAVYLATLERLHALAPLAAILPGHGPRIDDPKARLQLYLRHRRMREAEVLGAIAKGGATLEAIVHAIYEGNIPPHLLPLAHVSAQGHIEKLLREGRIRDEAGTFRMS